MRIVLTLAFTLCCLLSGLAQSSSPEPWIAYPSANISDYGVFHFRKTFDLKTVPEELVVHISADNRYTLFVNGQQVCYGPAKGDLKTYKYDIIDIAPFLSEGKNTLAARVYNAGKDMAMSMFSVQTAFLFRAENTAFSHLNSDESWKVKKNQAYAPVSYYEMLFKERWFYGYYACGPGDRVKAANYPWGWELGAYDDSSWENAQLLSFDGKAPWSLFPRNIAFMDQYSETPKKVRIAENVLNTGDFEKGAAAAFIEANTEATLLLDYEKLTMGYPDLYLEGGENAKIRIRYAEALYEEVNLKGHRDSVKGLTMYGVWDEFFPDGEERVFTPLWKRCFRYVQLEITTADDPLEIKAHINNYSGYPYPEMSSFNCNDPVLNEIFEMGLHTLRMCSGETYYDTPFYEQLSYGGDNRPIAAISTYNSTDDRLLREVMRLYPQSQNRETGLMKSAYPSRFDFDMGSWSLAWIQSLHDYYLLRGDAGYVMEFIPNIENVLGFYHRHMDESLGILGTVKNQNFMDWSISKGSIPRANENKEISHSTMLTLYYLHTLDCVIRLYEELGVKENIEKWKDEAEQLRNGLRKVCWDTEKQLFRDWPDSAVYSQHSNILAVLCNLVPEKEQKALMQRIINYKGFDEYASSYFSFFLFKAMVHTGMEDAFLKHLTFWEEFIQRGHSTCGETGFASHDRSDCHAWAAHPSYYLLSIVCGIRPGDIGFDKIEIMPHPGDLCDIKASMPHPKGRIEVAYTIKGSKLRGSIILPAGTSGVFKYNNNIVNLNEGINYIK